MRRLGVFALILSVSLLGQTSVTVAAGPLSESAKRAAQQLAEIQVESPKAAEARRVVTDLGVNRHVAVQLTSGKTFRGHVRTISEENFVILLDQDARLMEIAYGEVQKVGSNPGFEDLSRGAKVAIGVGVVAVALAVGFAIKNLQKYDIHPR
jgi:small nuclear ribonucleoprotein (snRNP)-like protein